MRTTILLVAALLLVACSQPPSPEPTVDLGATVQAAVEKALPTATNTPEPDLQATVHAGIAGTMEVMASAPSPTPIPQPTSTPIPPPTPTPTPLPTDTPTPIPTDTPTPIPTNTPTPTFTATATPTHTPTATYTPIPTDTPTPVPTDTPTPTPTETPTLIPTDTPTPIPTDTPTPSPTAIPTPSPTHTPTPIPTPTKTPIPTATPTPNTSLNLADIVEQARAGVVRIEGPSSSGSGFVVDSDGYILTNEHVISGQSRLTVVFDNGTRLTARVISSDATRDIALLKVTATSPLTVLPFATEVREGEEVVALGYPLNLGGSMTITKGIVSAFRTVRGVARIQTDAAINPGNSGGPLLNTKGEVVGMNTSSIEQSTSGRPVEGIGFAIKFDVLSSRFTAMRAGQLSPPTPVSTPAVVATQTPGYVFGPQRGNIQVEEIIPNSGYAAALVNTDTNLANAIVDVTFTTPNVIPRLTGSFSWIEWSPCVNLRARQRDAELWQHSICFYSSGAWYHSLVSGNVIETTARIHDGFSTSINTGRGATNHVRVIAVGETGFLFFNGEFEAELDLSGVTRSGESQLLISSTTGTSATRYSGFTVRPIQRAYGPRSASIKHNPGDGFIDDHETNISLTDGIIEARFFNPYGSGQGYWSSGFLLRDNGDDKFHVVIVLGEGRWIHRLRSGDTATEQRLADHYSHLISTTSSDSNYFRVIILGDEGWLFINGNYVDKLDLSGWQQRGSVSAIGSYFADDGLAGYSTRFENFTIWSAD